MSTPPEKIININGVDYVLADDIPNRPAISLTEYPKCPVGPGTVGTIVISDLTGGCNQRIVGDPRRYAYTVNADVSLRHTAQRSLTIDTYDLSSTYEFFQDSAGHRGSFFVEAVVENIYAGQTGRGMAYIVVPRHVILLNRHDSGTSTATGVTSLTDTGKAWTVNEWVNALLRTDTHWAIVTENTATVLTIAGWNKEGQQYDPAANKPDTGPYQVVLLDENAVRRGSAVYNPAPVCSLGNGILGDGQKLVPSDLDCGAFTGSALVSGRVLAGAKAIIAFGRECDGPDDAVFNAVKDGRTGAMAVKMERSTGAFSLCTFLRFSYGIQGPLATFCIINDPGTNILAQCYHPMIFKTPGVMDSMIGPDNIGSLFSCVYYTNMTFISDAFIVMDEFGRILQVVGLGALIVSKAPVVGGDGQFGMGATWFEGGLLAPHRAGLFFLTAGDSTGQWREVGLDSLAPGDALRDAYPRSFGNLQQGCVATAGAEIFYALGNTLFVIPRGWAGANLMIRPYGFIAQGPESRFGRSIAPDVIALGGSEAPPIHSLAQLWPDTTTASLNTITRSGVVATATAAAKHGLLSGDTVTIAGATPTAYNGTFKVTRVDQTHFTYVMAADPGASASGTLTYAAIELPIAMGIETEIGPETILWVASNRRKIYRVHIRTSLGSHYPASVAGSVGTLYGSHYGGDFPFSHCDKQFLQFRAWADCPNTDAAAATYTTLNATIVRVVSTAFVTCASPYPWSLGDVVTIAGADQGEYNGVHSITQIVDSTTFGYAVAGSPVSPATGTITGAGPLYADDSIQIKASFEGGSATNIGSPITTSGPCSVNFPSTDAAQARTAQPIIELTCGDTQGWPQLLFPWFIDFFAVPAVGDEFTMILEPAKPHVSWRDRLWRVLDPLFVRSTLAALIGSVVTIKFTTYDTTGWPCAILAVEETGDDKGRHIELRARRV